MFKSKIKSINKPLQHIAFIMDGNGRWAKRRFLPRNMGHNAGVVAVQDTIENAIKLNIRFITFYAFSTENWKRPQSEIDSLFEMFRDFLNKNKDSYKDRNIKINVMGDISKFPKDMIDSINDIVEQTQSCDMITVSFAFNYGGRDEILRAAKFMSQAGETEYTDENFRKYLYASEVPDPDIIVRTSGEQRLSNFLLYRAAYCEFYFTKVLWPDFNYKHFLKVIQDYNKRDRRFGSI